MWSYKYGNFSDEQMENVKIKMQKQIYFLLLYVDKNTMNQYKNVDVKLAFANIFNWFDGLNSLLNEPPELVKVISLLESALIEYSSEDFKFSRYRKLLLDAGNEVLKIKEVK